MNGESEFGAVLTSLGAAVAGANQFLQAQGEALRESAAGDPAGLALPVASFAIAEASFELVFTVERVDEEQPELPALVLRRLVNLGDPERASLLRSASREAAAALEDLLVGYEEVKKLYEFVRRDPAAAATIEIPADVRPSEEFLDELRAGASARARTILDRILADLDASRADLIETRRIARAGPQRSVFVRMDPAALREAGAGVQHARLTVRGTSQQIVDVDGDRIAVPE